MASGLDFLSLVHIPLPGFGKDIPLLAVQKCVGLGDVACVCGGGAHSSYQARFSIDTDVGLHVEARRSPFLVWLISGSRVHLPKPVLFLVALSVAFTMDRICSTS